MLDDIKARWLLRDADHKEDCARSLRRSQQYHLDQAVKHGVDADLLEAEVADLRAQVAAHTNQAPPAG
ncbi:hypothetical protein ABT336_11970 [Micromonospora sp. NPDC000207]|uniref:hypothetical protein n=1 Tax=Micromonospora sp. NPDC000207 TaxID=3154246 RepID=UPI0033180916